MGGLEVKIHTGTKCDRQWDKHASFAQENVRNHGMRCIPPFPDHEPGEDEDAYQQGGKDSGTSPWMSVSTVLQRDKTKQIRLLFPPSGS